MIKLKDIFKREVKEPDPPAPYEVPRIEPSPVTPKPPKKEKWNCKLMGHHSHLIKKVSHPRALEWVLVFYCEKCGEVRQESVRVD